MRLALSAAKPRKKWGHHRSLTSRLTLPDWKSERIMSLKEAAPAPPPHSSSTSSSGDGLILRRWRRPVSGEAAGTVRAAGRCLSAIGAKAASLAAFFRVGPPRLERAVSCCLHRGESPLEKDKQRRPVGLVEFSYPSARSRARKVMTPGPAAAGRRGLFSLPAPPEPPRARLATGPVSAEYLGEARRRVRVHT